ncbi:hypothetical protein HZC09_02185 [Candidatus Micrarchaeota archaeon]|nr:hypothetical protein [Candidatus Micrarchaeota archaeon]
MVRKTPKEERITHYLVETYGGNTLLGAGTRVWAKVGDKVAQKRVEHVVPGDKVFSSNTRVNVNLNQIIRALHEDDAEYRLAVEHLYVRPPAENARPFTRLQEYLFSTLEPKYGRAQLENQQGLNQAVEEIQAKFRSLKGKISKTSRKPPADFETAFSSISRSDQAVRNWLSGETVLPNNQHTIRLLEMLAPVRFKQVFGTSSVELKKGKEACALLWAHNHWETAHKILRNWVSGFSQIALSEEGRFEIPYESGSESRVRRSRSFADERRVVYDRLIKPILEQVTKEYGFIRVREVKPVSYASAEGAKKNAGPVLSKGVVPAEKIDPEEFGISKTSYGGLQRQNVVLEEFLLNALKDIPLPRAFYGSKTGHGQPIVNWLMTPKEEIENDPDTVGVYLTSTPTGFQPIALTKEEVLQTRQIAAHMLSSGQLDHDKGLPEGTFMRLLNQHLTLLNRLPLNEERVEFSLLFNDTGHVKRRISEGKFGKTPEEQAKGLVKTLNHLARAIESYGIPPHGVPPLLESKTREDFAKQLERTAAGHRRVFGQRLKQLFGSDKYLNDLREISSFEPVSRKDLVDAILSLVWIPSQQGS